jgi:hypothetical protein
MPDSDTSDACRVRDKPLRDTTKNVKALRDKAKAEAKAAASRKPKKGVVDD